MSVNRLTVTLVTIAAIATNTTSFGGGDGKQSPRTHLEATRMHQLFQILQSDVDEKKRKNALLELGRADPRLTTEVIPAINDTLLKDHSPAVRLTAVEVLAQYRAVFPMSGLALETAMESDPSVIVRSAAKQAIWEYHLMGYKSAKGGDGFAAETPEPPRAKPARQPIPVTAEPPVVPVVAKYPPPAIDQLPLVSPAPGPRVTLVPKSPAITALLTTVPPHPNLTVEPPLARPAKVVPSPIIMEPPILPRTPEPSTIVTPRPLVFDLPPIVPHPGKIAGVIPLPEPTIEPPICKPNRK